MHAHSRLGAAKGEISHQRGPRVQKSVLLRSERVVRPQGLRWCAGSRLRQRAPPPLLCSTSVAHPRGPDRAAAARSARERGASRLPRRQPHPTSWIAARPQSQRSSRHEKLTRKKGRGGGRPLARSLAPPPAAARRPAATNGASETRGPRCAAGVHGARAVGPQSPEKTPAAAKLTACPPPPPGRGGGAIAPLRAPRRTN